MEDLFDEIGFEYDSDKQIEFIEFLKEGKVVSRFKVSLDQYDTDNEYSLFKGIRRVQVSPTRAWFGLKKKIPPVSAFMPSLAMLLQPRLKLTYDGKLSVV